ncbi:hypothetical protein [Novosphingobium terrae]|jgi:hypothetical protein|uniref:hypothetical protein n=1 Tax=Novosphingobium terrae TaxID=2726189 RepID=UPI00197E9875|nr:hypothetical protein [Novosphingobium terrae]
MVKLQSSNPRPLRAAAMALGALVSVSAGSLIAHAQQTTSQPVVEKTDEKDHKAPKPVTKDNPNAQQVAETPLTDLNVKKGEIPPVLLRAQQDPYSLAGLKGCPAITNAVSQLNAVLGDDVDIAKAKKRNVGAGHVAQTVVGSFIPFRGIIREVSGASAEERKLQAAIAAGMARRGFLKGVGMTKGCRYPGRPA